MALMLVGLLIFLGVHSVRVFADGWRARTIARIGEGPWKGAYSLLSLAGFVMIVLGFGLARQQPVLLWQPPASMRHLAALLVLLAFIGVAAAYVPGNMIRARLHHPMVLGVKTWAVAHLLANGTLADVLLFGSFLLWAVLSFIAARRRDRVDNTVYRPGTLAPTVATLLAGVAAWAGFAFWLHAAWIGVRPFG